MIPAYLSVLLPTYVRPADDDDEPENPMKPLVAKDDEHGLAQHGGVPYDAPGTPDSSKGIKWGLQKKGDYPAH